MQEKLNKLEEINLSNIGKRNLNKIDFTKTQFHVICHQKDEINEKLDNAMSKAIIVEEETKNRLIKEKEIIKIKNKNIIERNKIAFSKAKADKYQDEMNKALPILENVDRNIRLQMKYEDHDYNNYQTIDKVK